MTTKRRTTRITGTRKTTFGVSVSAIKEIKKCAHDYGSIGRAVLAATEVLWERSKYGKEVPFELPDRVDYQLLSFSLALRTDALIDSMEHLWGGMGRVLDACAKVLGEMSRNFPADYSPPDLWTGGWVAGDGDAFVENGQKPDRSEVSSIDGPVRHVPPKSESERNTDIWGVHTVTLDDLVAEYNKAFFQPGRFKIHEPSAGGEDAMVVL